METDSDTPLTRFKISNSTRTQHGLNRPKIKPRMDIMIKNFTPIPALIIASLLATSLTASAQEDSLTPYTHASEVPQTAVDLWKDYDPCKEDLEVKTHKEWKQDGVVSRLISFKVGTFKGCDARIAAYYCFPENGKKNTHSRRAAYAAPY